MSRPPLVQDAAGDEAKAQSRPLSVLLVEDDFLARRVLKGLLADRGDCDIAADGREAVEAFAQAEASGRHYDLVCVDLMLPGMDGFETVRALRNIEMAEAVKSLAADASKLRDLSRHDSVILITTAVEDPAAYIKACYTCGANGYLVKPIDKAKLLAVLASKGL